MPGPAKGSALLIKVPQFQFPSVSTSDRYLVEYHDHSSPRFGPGDVGKPTEIPDYGLVHPVRAGFRLVRILPSDSPNIFQWIWRNESTVADHNNFITSFAEESRDHPTFVRRYVAMRETYEASTRPDMLSPLKVVVGLINVAGGQTALKDGVYDLEFSGGAGTGVAGKYQVAGGTVVAQWLTACGADYTSAPTVTVPGVDEAEITAYVQPQTALLVHEEATPYDGQESSIFLNVTTMYETLPGPVLVGRRYDHDKLTLVKTERQRVASNDAAATSPTFGLGKLELVIKPIDANRSEILTDSVNGGGTVPPKTELLSLDEKTGTGIYLTTLYVPVATATPTFDDTVDGRYVFNVKELPYSAVEKIQLIWSVDLPESYFEYPLVGFQFPAIFTVNDFTWTDYTLPSRFPYPHPGDPDIAGYYFLEAHRQARFPAKELNVFTFGEPEPIDAGFVVSTPGVMSSYFRIPANTIHKAFKIYELLDDGLGGTILTLVEDIPSSTPPKYTKGDVITLAAESSRWRGKIYRTRITQLSEDKNFISDGAEVLNVFQLKNLNSGFTQMDDFARVYVKCLSTAEVVFHINGHGTTGALSNTTITKAAGVGGFDDIVVSSVTIGGLTSISLAGSVPSSPIINPSAQGASLYAESATRGVWRYAASANFVDGDNVVVHSGDVLVAYYFRTVIASVEDVLLGGTRQASLENLAAVIGNTGISGTTWFAGSTHFPEFTADASGAASGYFELTDTVGCLRSTVEFGGGHTPTVTITTPVVGEEGQLLATWGAAETLPASKVNTILLNQKISSHGRENLDPYVSGTTATVTVANKAGELVIVKAAGVVMTYSYKVSGTFNSPTTVVGNSKRIPIPATTGIRVTVTGIATPTNCYVAFSQSA